MSCNGTERPLFIVGADRSGTTMLRLMLNEHPEMMIPRETWFLIDLMNSLPVDGVLTDSQRADAYRIIVTHRRWKDLEIDDVAFFAAVGRLHEPTLAQVAETVFRELLKRTGKRRWGDKTPEYVIEIERLHRLFPAAQFIHVIRDARDVCISLLGKPWRGPHTRNVARYWADYVGRGIASGRALPVDHYLEVHYENLVSNTDAVLRRICSFVDLEYTPALMRFYESATKNIAPWEHEHHAKTLRPPRPDDVGRWRTGASSFQLIVIEALAGAVMDKVGQQRRYRGFSRLLPRSVSAIEQVFRRGLALRRALLARI